MPGKADRKKRRTYAPTLTNRKARHNYFVLEAFEAGIELKGAEVKSVRDGEVSLDEAFARVHDHELWLYGCHIKPYEYGDARRQPDPTRRRKLLLHRRQINSLVGSLSQKGVTMVPLSMYFKRGRVKVEVALVRGKQRYDKRQAIRQKEQRREIDRALGRRR